MNFRYGAVFVVGIAAMLLGVLALRPGVSGRATLEGSKVSAASTATDPAPRLFWSSFSLRRVARAVRRPMRCYAHLAAHSPFLAPTLLFLKSMWTIGIGSAGRIRFLRRLLRRARTNMPRPSEAMKFTRRRWSSTETRNLSAARTATLCARFVPRAGRRNLLYTSPGKGRCSGYPRRAPDQSLARRRPTAISRRR